MANTHQKPDAKAERRGNAASPKSAGHVLLPAAAITGMSLGLAAGLELLGVVGRVNDGVASLVSRGGAEKFPKRLPEFHEWIAAALLALGLSLAMLGTPGMPRRLLLCATTLILVGTWAPVLSLAAHQPEIAVPWIATLWSGFCAMIYSSRHRVAREAHTRPPP